MFAQLKTGFKHNNPIFPQDILTYNEGPSNQVQLQKDLQFGKCNRNSPILIIWALVVILTLKTATKCFCMTLQLMMVDASPYQVWLQVVQASPYQVWLQAVQASPYQAGLQTVQASPYQVWLQAVQASPYQAGLQTVQALPYQVWLQALLASPYQV